VRAQTNEALAARVGGERSQPIARLVVRRRELRLCERGHGWARAAYGLRRRPRTGSGRGSFQTSCLVARPDAISNSAMLSATRTFMYVS
jgi:hypothetical protein